MLFWAVIDVFVCQACPLIPSCLAWPSLTQLCCWLLVVPAGGVLKGIPARKRHTHLMLQDSIVLATTHLSPSPGAEGDRTMCATVQDGSLVVKPAPSPSQPQSPLPATSGAGSACCSVSPSVAAVHSPAVYGSSTVSSSPSSNCCTSTASPPALPACALPDCAQTSLQQQQQQGRGPGHLDQGAPAAAASMRLATPFTAAAAEAIAGPSGVQEADSDTEAAPADIAATAAAEEPGTRPGAGVGGTQQPGSGQVAPCILKELGVSGPSLVRLLTGDCAVESQQPVWMVVNLQVCVCVCVSERVSVSVCVGH